MNGKRQMFRDIAIGMKWALVGALLDTMSWGVLQI